MSDDNGHQGEIVIEDIRSLAIPPGWTRTSVGEVGEVRLGRQRSPKNRSAEFPTKYVRAANLTWTGLDLSDVRDMDFPPRELVSYRLQRGDVLLSEASGSAGEVGKPAIWNGELENCCFQNTVIRFRPKAVSSKFALVAFQHFARNSVFARVSKGVGIHHMSADRFASMPFLLPPKEEQGRIVAKVEELFSDLDAGIAALKRVKANLKRYRAVVLKAAVEGKLTEAWRVEAASRRFSPDPQMRQDAASTFEPASALLARILKERRQKWEADQLAKCATVEAASRRFSERNGKVKRRDAASTKKPPKNWREKYVEPTPPNMKGLPELPEGWCWASVDQLGDVQLGRQRSPKNRSDEFPTKYIRAANLTEDGLDLADVLDMEFQPRELETYRLHPGDVLLSEASGSPDQVGKPVVWNGEIDDCCFQNTVIRLRPIGIPSEYPLAVFRHYYRSKLFAKVSAGVGINHLSAGKFSALPFPLAPLAEQRLIAAEVEERLSVIAVAEQQLESNLTRADRLRQSILTQAFEGKLVPQDPKDEPASVLLERLRASRSVHEGNGKAANPARTRGRRVKSKQVSLQGEEEER